MAEYTRAVGIKGGKGPISSLFIDTEYSKPKPKDGQALVHIKAFGINRMDLLQREGNYPLPPQAQGLPMGVEFSGVIESFGSPSGDHETFKVGDEVFGLAYGGAYAEYVTVSTHMLIHKPKELSWEVAAGIPETWITATQALYLVGGFKPGKSVLWHAGASSVSIAGVQISKGDGASKVYVTASTQEKINCAKSLGADVGFSYKEGDWSEALLKATNGKGADIIIDFIGGPYFEQNLNAVARDGHIVNLGFLGGPKVKPANGTDIDISKFLVKRARYEGTTLRSRDETYQGKLRDLVVEHSLPKLKNGTFRVPIEKVFKMEEIQDAHTLMESNKTMGKLICTVDWQ